MSGRKRQRIVPGLRKRARPSSVSDGTKALALVRKLKNQQELKVHTTTGTTLVKQQILSLHDIAEGDSGNARDGLGIVCKKLELQGTIYQQESAADSVNPVFVTVSVVRDKQTPSGIVPAYTSVFDNSPRFGTSIDTENIKRWQVLYHRKFVLKQIANTTDGGQNLKDAHVFTKTIMLKDLNIRWQGSTGTSIQQNGLFLCFDFEDTGGSTAANVATMSYSARLWFNDP